MRFIKLTDYTEKHVQLISIDYIASVQPHDRDHTKLIMSNGHYIYIEENTFEVECAILHRMRITQV